MFAALPPGRKDEWLETVDHPECICLKFERMRVRPSNLVDVRTGEKENLLLRNFAICAGLILMTWHGGVAQSQVAAGAAGVAATGNDLQAGVPQEGPPPSSVGVFPLSSVHKGLHGTAWTVFEGTKPEPMDVEILGVLHGARGPRRDLILARLHGAKPEYTGVVAGMSGSPVYIDGKLAGALSYRIGQFSKEPIAGITPIEQMLEVRDLPAGDLSDRRENPTSGAQNASDRRHPNSLSSSGMGSSDSTDGSSFRAMETPLLMSGFGPEAVRIWKERMAGTGLDLVSAGGGVGGAGSDADFGPVVPGSAVSLQLASGDMEIAATCTVTYVDPKQLLACGHPIQQSGSISMPMTSTEVVATLASPLNAFKIVNTGKTIGAFTQDRDAAILGQFGTKARMIPVSIGVEAYGKTSDYKVGVVDLPGLSPSIVLVTLYQAMLQSNESSADTSYHVTGEIKLRGVPAVPIDAWGAPSLPTGNQMAPQLEAALAVGNSFNQLYTNAARRGPIESVNLRVESIARNLRVELEGVRLVSSNVVHAGDTVMVEATLRPWQQEARNVRIPIKLPARLEPGTLRLVVGSGAMLDRTLDAGRPANHGADEADVAAHLAGMHAEDQVYVALLMPESAASLAGDTLEDLPLSMANTMESQRGGVEAGLHGESLVVAGQAAAGGVLSGQQLLTLRVEGGGGLH